MQAINESDIGIVNAPMQTAPVCYHCGVKCIGKKIRIDEKFFCCQGCKLVYELINENGLCDYYTLQSHPGLSQIKAVRNDKYLFLDNDAIAQKLYRFTNEDLTIVVLYIPAIHCSSCMWLLEHLNRLDAGIKDSRINFTAKELTIHFSPRNTSFRKIVELLATIGYEPYISLDDAENKISGSINRERIIRLGVAGFCFGNIMMMSFPEYLSGADGIEGKYTFLFRYLNLILSLPVFFYSATEFYTTAWAGLKQKTLNIDAPIVLALVITFSRSIYEIITNTGAGYLDSMSGIVFFMLVGRLIQERTYSSLSFTRNYKSYFPVAVNVSTPEGLKSTQLQDLKKNDIITLHNGEIVPADAIVLSDNAMIDYSFVTGESEPVMVKKNEMVYAGGRQTGVKLTIQVLKPIAGSYLTSLWNHYAFRKNKHTVNDTNSVLHVLSRYFTVILFTLAALTATYWFYTDPSKIITSVSAMLIVACPCALLLAVTFTNSNILRIFGLNGLYLRDATVIEQIAKTDHIVFDKTGTVTSPGNNDISYSGHKLTETEKDVLYAVVSQSTHPNSITLAQGLGVRTGVELDAWKEIPGNGIEAMAGSNSILVGSAQFVGIADDQNTTGVRATFYLKFNGMLSAFYVEAGVRPGMRSLIYELKKRYKLSLLSGDNDRQRSAVEKLFGKDSELLFEQKPVDKLGYINRLQLSGENVIMIGDGLNDAGALQQSNVGISITEDVNNFTPACDAIFDAARLERLPSLLQLSRTSTIIIRMSFAISVLYNIAGLYFAMTAQMKPVVAAILMPCSTLSIVIISSGYSNLVAWANKLVTRSSK